MRSSVAADFGQYIDTFFRDERIVRSPLNNIAIVQDDDQIRIFDRAQSVCDDKRGFAFQHAV